MLRRAAFLLLTCWIASDSGAVSAQPGAPDKCSYRPIAMAVREGSNPDVSGCSVIQVVRNLQEAGIRPTGAETPDTNVEKGLVSRVEVDGRAATIYVSTGPPPPPTPPAPQGEPTPTPPPPVNIDPVPAPTPPPPEQPPAYTGGEAGPTESPGNPEIINEAATPPGETLQPTSYSVSAAENIPREAAVTFTIRRSGPLRPADVEFDFVQNNDLVEPAGMEHPLRFAEGEASKVLTLPANSYSPCRTPTLILRLEPPVQASPTFANPAPDYCRETPPQFPPPWWWIPACLIGIAALGYLIRKIWPPTPTPPSLYPTWEAELVEPRGETSVPTIPGWPRFAARTEIEWGGTSLPEPLPIAETDHE